MAKKLPKKLAKKRSPQPAKAARGMKRNSRPVAKSQPGGRSPKIKILNVIEPPGGTTITPVRSSKVCVRYQHPQQAEDVQARIYSSIPNPIPSQPTGGTTLALTSTNWIYCAEVSSGAAGITVPLQQRHLIVWVKVNGSWLAPIGPKTFSVIDIDSLPQSCYCG